SGEGAEAPCHMRYPAPQRGGGRTLKMREANMDGRIAWRLAGAALAAAMLMATPAMAQRPASWDACMNQRNAAASADAAIAACTSVIEAFSRGQIGRADAAAAHLRRGSAHAAKGELGPATADYDQAIAHYDRIAESEPNNRDALLGRGSAAFLKQNYDAAIA